MNWLSRLLKQSKPSSDDFKVEKTGEFKNREEADQAVIGQLVSLGADMEQPREVNHYFYFGDGESARTVSRLLIEQGLAAENRPAAAGPKKWCVFATHRIVVRPEHMVGLTTNLERLAIEHGGEYDGWEASLEGSAPTAQSQS